MAFTANGVKRIGKNVLALLKEKNNDFVVELDPIYSQSKKEKKNKKKIRLQSRKHTLQDDDEIIIDFVFYLCTQMLVVKLPT